MIDTNALHGRRILVTGASSGIGAATCRAIVAAGGAVAMVARRGDRLAELRDELGAGAVDVPGDVTDLDGLGDVVAAAHERLGGLDGVVTVAGRSMVGTITTGTPAKWLRLAALNLVAPLAVVRTAVPRFAGTGRRDVILVGSTAACTPMVGTAIYAATKQGLQTAADTLRLELAPHGIGVGVVLPGMFDTEGLTMDGVEFDGDIPPTTMPFFTDGRGPIDPAPLAATIVFMLGQPDGYVINSVIARPCGQLHP